MSLSKKSVSDAQDLIAMKKTEGGDKPVKPRPLTDEELMKFGQFGGTADVKEKASYLGKKGLVGASQLYNDHPNLSSKDGILNAQSDWKASAMSLLLMKARQFGLKSPTEISANKDALLSSLPPKYKEAINHPVFNQIHPNWWDTFNSVLKDQYDNEATLPISTQIAKK